MSMENAKKFLELLQKDPGAAELLNAQEKSENEEAVFAAYADAAKKLGFEATPAEFKALCDEIYRETAEKTETSATGMQKLTVEELDLVAAAGDHSSCLTSYQHKENCWVVDACDKAIYGYKGYWCERMSRNYCEQVSDEAP